MHTLKSNQSRFEIKIEPDKQEKLKIRRLESVHLKFYQKNSNVGDRISLAVAQRYFSPNVIPCNERPLTIPNLILVGSFLHYADACSYVCGAGFISTEPKYLLRAVPKSVNCVRGPLTGHLLEKQGIKHPRLYGDPGILAPLIYPQRSTSSNKIGVIPHYVDAGASWISLCRKMGLHVIDVFAPLQNFFAEINQCRVILSSSLHGIIFAHAYDKPALWIELSDKVIGNGFKFYDYYLSVGIRPENVRRIRVSDNTDPFEIVKLATVPAHSNLQASLEEAICKTHQELDRTKTTVKMESFSKSFACADKQSD